MGVEVDFESWLKAQGLSPEEIKRKADETEAAWEARLSLLKPGESLVRMPKDTAITNLKTNFPKLSDMIR
jgi:hypothetical protein